MPLQAILSTSVTQTAHSIWKNWVRPGDWVCDATAGNGHDTLLLTHLVGPSGRVWALDRQPAAILSTQQRLQRECSPQERAAVTLVEGCHSLWPLEIPERSIRLCVYNLGYLPGGDASQTTFTETTLRSLKNMEALLATEGLICCVCYPGHDEGAREAEAVCMWAADLPRQEWSAHQINWMNRTRAPFIVLAYKQSHREALDL